MRITATVMFLIISLLMPGPAIAEPYYRGAEVGEGVEAGKGAVKNHNWGELLGRYIFGLQETE